MIENYGAVGYEGLQLKAAQYLPYIDEPQKFCDEWGAYLGVASGLISGGRLDEEGIARLRTLFGFARDVGSERIVFCHGVPRAEVTPDDIRHYARQLSELAKEAQDQEVALSLHHHFNQPVMHREDIALFFDHATPGTVGLTVDTAHLVKSGIADIGGVIRQFGEQIDNFHLKDFADGDWRVLGQGAIDFSQVFEAVRAIDYSGWLCVDEESGDDLLGGMRICYEFLRSQVATA